MRVLFVVLAFVGLSAQAAELHQHDTDFKVDNLTFQHRHDPQIDLNHFQVGVKLTERITTETRLSEVGSKQEFRTRLLLEHKWDLTDRLGLSYKNYFELRAFDYGDGTGIDEFFRYQGRTKLDYTFTDRLDGYISERSKFIRTDGWYEHELEVGVGVDLSDSVSLNVFSRYVTDKDLDRSGTMTGTVLTFKF